MIATRHTVPDGKQRPAPPAADEPPQPARHGQRGDDRDPADEDQVPRAVLGKPLLQREQDQRPDDRALNGPDAADQHHEQHLHAVLHGEHRGGLYELRLQRDKRADRSRACRGREVGKQPYPADPDAEDARGDRIATDGPRVKPEPGSHEQEHAADRECRDDQRGPVDHRLAEHRAVARQSWQADAGGAADRGGKGHRDLEHRGHDQAGHREVAAGQPEQQPGHRKGHQPRDDRRGGDARERVDPVHRDQVQAVRADAEVRVLPERRQAAEAGQQVPRGGHRDEGERHDQRLLRGTAGEVGHGGEHRQPHGKRPDRAGGRRAPPAHLDLRGPRHRCDLVTLHPVTCAVLAC